MKTVRILVADDHELIRSGIKYIIRETEDIVLVGEADNGADALKLARTIEWDVAILDVNMPSRSGIEVLKHVLQEYPKRAVLMLSMYPEEQYAVRAIETGAAGYLTKQSVSAELVKAIRHVAKGGKYITPLLAEKLASALSNRKRENVDVLSNRELQVLMLLSSGKTLVQTAERLSINVSTVSIYRRRILDKLGLSNTGELIRYGIENGLAE
jgi:two-component system invasion response regulator UvrY